jgi:hypothetical protein
MFRFNYLKLTIEAKNYCEHFFRQIKSPLQVENLTIQFIKTLHSSDVVSRWPICLAHKNFSSTETELKRVN